MSVNRESESSGASQLNPSVKKNKKKLYGVLGGTALAVAVAFGGSSILGQTPTTNAQTATPSQPATTPGTGTKPAPQNGQTGNGNAQPGQNGTGGQRGGPGP